MVMKHTKKRAMASHEDGFTLVELLVVLGIIVMLAALVAPQVIRYLGQYPSTEDGLLALVTAPASAKAWRGPYLKRKDGVTDPWGKPFTYKVPGEKGEYDVFSLGRDGQPGGEGEDKDLTNW
jgi:general secretion pathway protein G